MSGAPNVAPNNQHLCPGGVKGKGPQDQNCATQKQNNDAHCREHAHKYAEGGMSRSLWEVELLLHQRQGSAHLGFFIFYFLWCNRWAGLYSAADFTPPDEVNNSFNVSVSRRVKAQWKR